MGEVTGSVLTWSMTSDDIDNGRRCRLEKEGIPLTFQELFTALSSDSDFADWYSDQLANCSFSAAFWEHPPLTISNVGRVAEFVIIDAPSLANVPPNPGPFRSYFDSADASAPVSFPSLGQDALLIAPGPGIGLDAGAHLMTFLRHAPRENVRQLWRLAADSLLQRLSDVPIWLSTSGLGVHWLHLRLDSFPKYYQYLPYRSADSIQ